MRVEDSKLLEQKEDRLHCTEI